MHPSLEAISRLDAEGDRQVHERRAIAINAVLCAIEQRGVRRFTDADAQAAHVIGAILEKVADEEARRPIAEGFAPGATRGVEIAALKAVESVLAPPAEVAEPLPKVA